jgi:gluconokinase
MTNEERGEPNLDTGLLLDRLIVASRDQMYRHGTLPCTELVIAGPSNTGKTRFGAYAAGMLRYNFVEGDLFHHQRVMELARTHAVPMTDEYRETQWFQAITGALLFAALQHMEIVLTCSALKRQFRRMLTELGSEVGMGELWIVWLDVPANILKERAARRQKATNHPFGPEMIDSQLADAETPQSDEEHVVVVDGTLDAPELLREILRRVPGLPAIGV